MKKLPAIIWAAALILLACAQVATAQDCPGGSVINVSVQGDRLAFASIEEYRRAVDQPSQDTRKQLARNIAALPGFTSYAEANPDRSGSLMPDEYFASIVNANIVVQIGDNIFRVNPATERVYVLPVAHENEYGDLLAENILNPHIQSFSVDDDVLDEIEGGVASLKGTQQMGFSCKETGIGNKSASEYAVYAGKPKGTAEAYFKRYGIYFTLFAKMPFDLGGLLQYTIEFKGGIANNQGQVFYRKRCNGEVSYEISSSGYTSGHDRFYQSYEGSRTLNKVYFFFRLKATNSFGGAYLTPFVGFRANK